MNVDEPAPSEHVKSLAVRAMEIMANGSRADFDSVVHSGAFNRESATEPPRTRGRGPDAFYASAVWLRSAFTELRFDVEHVVVEGDLAVVHTIMKAGTSDPSSLRRAGIDRSGVRAHGAIVGGQPVALVARRRRPRHRALGHPGRPRSGGPAGLGTADAAVDGPQCLGQACSAQECIALTPDPCRNGDDSS